MPSPNLNGVVLKLNSCTFQRTVASHSIHVNFCVFLQTANLCEHLLLFTLVREGAEKSLYPEYHYIPAAAPI